MKTRTKVISLSILAVIAVFAVAPIFVVPYAESNGMIACPAGHSAQDYFANGMWHINEGATISYKFVQMNPQGKVVQVSQVCDKTIVNDGYDILSQMMGNHLSMTMYMTFSNATGAAGATDHWCGATAGAGTAGPMTTRGFGVLATTYAHTNGTSTFTLTSATVTVTGGAAQTVATICIQGHNVAGTSGGTTAQLIDEGVQASTQSINSGNSVYAVATITP